MFGDQGKSMAAMQMFQRQMQAAQRGEPFDMSSVNMNDMPFLNRLSPEEQAKAMATMQMFQKQMQAAARTGGGQHGDGSFENLNSGNPVQAMAAMQMMQKQMQAATTASGGQHHFGTSSAMNSMPVDNLNRAQHSSSGSSIQVALMNNVHEALNVLPTAEIEKLLESNPAIVNQKGFNGMSPLHKVVFRGDPVVLDIFLKHKVNVNARNDHEETPLHFACKKGHPVLVEKLILAGADVKATDRSGRGAMHHAAMGGSVLTMHYLNVMHSIEFTGGDSNLITPLHLSCAHGHEEGLLYLIRNNRCSIHVRDIHGNTSMHIAAQYGQAFICWKLMEIGGLKMIHETNKEGLTPLNLAQRGSVERNKVVIDTLLVYGLMKNTNDKATGPTPVWYGLLCGPSVAFYLVVMLSNMFKYSGWPMVIFTALLGYFIYNQHHRMNHISKWPNPIQAGMFAGGILSTMVFYMHDVLPAVYMGSPLFAILTMLGCVLMVYLYFRLMTSDPGICRESARKESTGHSYTVRDIASGEIRLQALCTICEVIPPRRSRHCRLCEKCYMDCDHHCLFLYRCIARYNHRFFIFFIAYCIAAMLTFTWVAGQYCAGLFPTMATSTAILTAFNEHPGLVALIFINALSSIWLMTLVGTQLKLISQCHTTAYQPGKSNLNFSQRLRNVIHFLAGKSPYAVDSVVRAT